MVATQEAQLIPPILRLILLVICPLILFFPPCTTWKNSLFAFSFLSLNVAAPDACQISPPLGRSSSAKVLWSHNHKLPQSGPQASVASPLLYWFYPSYAAHV